MSYTQKRHNRAQARKDSYTHMIRKHNILKTWGNDAIEGIEKHQLHRLNKRKIHCSCPLCREKTKEKGWKHSDKKKLMKFTEVYDI